MNKPMCACRNCDYLVSLDSDPNGEGICKIHTYDDRPYDEKRKNGVKVPKGWLCRSWHKEGVRVIGRKTERKKKEWFD